MVMGIASTIVLLLLVALIEIQGEVSSRWGEVVKGPRWWERVPWIGIAGIIACITAIIALLLTW